MNHVAFLAIIGIYLVCTPSISSYIFA